MALDLCCYTSLAPQDAEIPHGSSSDLLKSAFGAGLVVYEVRAVDDDYREIASEFGLSAASRFLISVNDKEGIASRLSEVAAILVGEFGERNILVLLNNESPIK